MNHVCSPFCTDSCFAPPKPVPSVAHGCKTCSSGFTPKGDSTCTIDCPLPTEIPNADNTACVSCPSCCGGSEECSYDFTKKDPPLKCNGTVNPEFNWDNGKCTPIPINPPDDDYD